MIDYDRLAAEYARHRSVHPYRDRAFSSLHLIPQEAFARGLARMEQDLREGPIHCVSRYLLLWGVTPGG
ncbi:MAG: hypothetical protein A2Z07_02230 [Armatimonadetes bacterium RBG_16_67_12]|nr:MAG: hypothetical protein A2Z07_02230 [Armatimonadetes bacterium RBG_16_67_12]